ncbi:MAG TPA: DUF4129 domain-containing protein [Intrasporangium sp.]|nr:DUF4129 domain-containing protein [Intrasporangium sp.]
MNSARVRTVLAGAAALVAAFLLVWAAASGPSGVVGEWNPPTVDGPTRNDVENQGPGFGSPIDEDPPRMSETEGGEGNVDWLDDLLALVVLAGALLLLRSFLPLIARWAANALPEKQAVADVEPVPEPETARDVLVREEERQRDALAGGEARDGIVACWVVFEDAAADAGLPRRVSETPTEFVVHLLHALDVDPRPVAVLAGLYHEARFSSHRMPDDSRARAEEALAAIHRDLHVKVA